MARTKTPAAPAAPSAAHAAPALAPAPDAAPAPGSPAAAVHAALAASPGATAAAIASAAGIGKPAAREELIAMEKAGTVTRVKGARPGIADTWSLAGAMPPGGGPAPDPEDKQDGQPGDTPDGDLNGASEDTTADRAGQDGTAEPGDPAREVGSTTVAPDPETEQSGPHNAVADGDREDAVPGEHDDEAVPGTDGTPDPGDGDAPHEEDDVPADGDGEASDAPDPAVVTEIAGRIAQIKTAADAAAIVLTAGGNLPAALAGLDEIREQAAQARRELKAAIGGRKAPAARPGALRDKVLAHLDEHPDGEFTPHEIHKVLGNSSGAIANALDTLVKLGAAELTTEKPRRFRRAARPTDAGPEADGTGGAQADGTDLAGAA